LERLLHRAGGEGDAEWLDGYLAGIELAPHPVPAETWAGRLISAPELLRDRAAAQRLADLALQRHDGLLECLETPQDVRDSVRATGDAGLAAWARGFLQATEAYPDAWPAETLSPSDREMLSALAALGRNGAPVPDRTALADWLIGRAGQ
jgi:yecA family protein